ncbi:hypothetical protein Ahy_B05g078017 [Arachis hypogaea]|uniref:Replication factor A C-terminal domain-containing protein n=1 Tax=Arachis hypogaea TaxID=3818 RepID=A0A444Z640_ARAHY|nr:hypothetical protein Ahy_B05g078017 [Arachis hypogaea]
MCSTTIKGEKIHASIKRALVSRSVNLLKKGISYQIRYFSVGLNESNFKTTHHGLLELSSIPRYGFNFVSFDILNAPDVRYLAEIGNERTLEKDGKFTKKIIECALFGNYTHELNAFLGFDNKDETVVVLQFVRNFMYGIKMFFNLKEANVIQFKNRYQIKLGVIDDSDCAYFIIFDKEAKQVLGKSCIEILDPLLLKGNLSDTPTLLLNLIDKTFLFIVEVQISDNPHFSPSYKVKKMTDNVDLINKFKKAYPIQIDVDYTSDLLLTSKASSIIKGEKVEGAKNLLLEFSNEVVKNDESEYKEIPQLARRSRLRIKLENLDAHVLESILESI